MHNTHLHNSPFPPCEQEDVQWQMADGGDWVTHSFDKGRKKRRHTPIPQNDLRLNGTSKQAQDVGGDLAQKSPNFQSSLLWRAEGLRPWLDFVRG